MKEKTKYVCECCNKEFDSESDCYDHEVQHLKITSLCVARFTEKDVLPYAVIVTLSDGTSANYYLPEDTVNPKIK